jgi:hypothetical protein
MNHTTYEMVKKSLTRHGRIPLLTRVTRLWCSECNSLQRVKDAFSRTCVLDCGHRRLTVLRTDAEVAAFAEADKKHRGRKLVSGCNARQGFTRTYEIVEAA